MNIISCYPKTEDEEKEFNKLLSKIHKDAAIDYIKSLQYPISFKIELIGRLNTAIKNRPD